MMDRIQVYHLASRSVADMPLKGLAGINGPSTMANFCWLSISRVLVVGEWISGNP
jgi:hypothetical protein